MKIYALSVIVLLLLNTCTLQGSAKEDEQSKRLSDRDEVISKLFTYLFGVTAPEEIEHVIKRKLSEDQQLQESVHRISTSSSDSDYDDPDRDVRRMVMDAISEVLREKHTDMCDAQLQLQMREREVRQERYKFYAAFMGSITAAVGLGTTLFAYNVTT